MSFEYRYFRGSGEPRSIDEKGCNTFADQMVRAAHDYMTKTGRKPTHIVLGLDEHCKLDGLEWLYRKQNRIFHDPKLTGRRKEFQGMAILWSSLDSCLMAVEQVGV
jgi:hypothetical protein